MTDPKQTPRIALVHDWLCGYRGGEAVLDRLVTLVSERFRPAGLFVMFDDRRPLTRAIDASDRQVSLVGKLPGASALRRWLLPAYPTAVSSLSGLLARAHRAEPLDLVISSSSAAVKGVRAPAGVPHLCYCHSPARYLWGRADQYTAGDAGALRALGLRLCGPALRRWDRRSAANVSRFVANSTFIASEIRRCYGRDAVVVHPPVRTNFFTPDPAVRREDFWLVAGALEPYKRVDLALGAAHAAHRKLVVVGTGSQEASLRAAAESNVEFRGRVSDETLRDLYRRAELLLFPQLEDFGIVAVEAQACGLPVVARRAGGALDSVIENVTGAFFDEATVPSFLQAAERAPRGADSDCRRNAERFASQAFNQAMLDQINDLLGRR